MQQTATYTIASPRSEWRSPLFNLYDPCVIYSLSSAAALTDVYKG